MKTFPGVFEAGNFPCSLRKEKKNVMTIIIIDFSFCVSVIEVLQ